MVITKAPSGDALNDMTNEGNTEPTAHAKLIRELRLKFGVGLVGKDENLDLEAIEALTERTLRNLLLRKGLSEEDMGFNLRMLHLWEITSRKIDLVSLMGEKYGCSRIMALSLAVKEIERCKEEVGELLEQMNHPQDKQALGELVLGFGSVAGLKYYPDLLSEARKVGALRSEPYAPRGQVVDYFEEPIYELIEARFALDAIWDGAAAMMDGASLHDIQLAKTLHPQLDADAEVVKARRSLGIPEGGFKDLEAAYQWARPRLADWSRCDDACQQELVLWESFTWEPHWKIVIGRGYIMLNLPEMHEKLRRLVDQYHLGHAWYRALPFYLVRGRLEPPPKVKKGRPRKEERDELLTDLVDEYGYELAHLVYNLGLAPADLANILERDPTILLGELHIELHKLADKRKSTLPKKKRVSYDALRKLVSRRRARRAAIAKYQDHVTQTRA